MTPNIPSGNAPPNLWINYIYRIIAIVLSKSLQLYYWMDNASTQCKKITYKA